MQNWTVCEETFKTKVQIKQNLLTQNITREVNYMQMNIPMKKPQVHGATHKA